MSKRSDSRAACLLKLERPECRALLAQMSERQQHLLRHY